MGPRDDHKVESDLFGELGWLSMTFCINGSEKCGGVNEQSKRIRERGIFYKTRSEASRWSKYGTGWGVGKQMGGSGELSFGMQWAVYTGQ